MRAHTPPAYFPPRRALRTHSARTCCGGNVSMEHSKHAVTRGTMTRTCPLKPSVPPSMYGMICGGRADADAISGGRCVCVCVRAWGAVMRTRVRYAKQREAWSCHTDEHWSNNRLPGRARLPEYCSRCTTHTLACSVSSFTISPSSSTGTKEQSSEFIQRRATRLSRPPAWTQGTGRDGDARGRHGAHVRGVSDAGGALLRSCAPCPSTPGLRDHEGTARPSPHPSHHHTWPRTHARAHQ